MKNFILWLSVLSLFIFVSTSFATSFTNPGFEEPGYLSGWTYSGIVSQVSSGTVSFEGGYYSYDITAQEGNNMALLSAPGLSAGGDYTNNWISQDLSDFQGGTLSFYYNMFSTDWNTNDRFTITFRDDSNNEIYSWETDEYHADIPIIDWELYYSDWQQFSYDFGAFTGPLSMSIKLASGNGVDDNWNTWTYLDNFLVTSAQPIPEPSTWVLLCLGLVGIVGVKKKFS